MVLISDSLRFEIPSEGENRKWRDWTRLHKYDHAVHCNTSLFLYSTWQDLSVLCKHRFNASCEHPLLDKGIVTLFKWLNDLLKATHQVGSRAKSRTQVSYYSQTFPILPPHKPAKIWACLYWKTMGILPLTSMWDWAQNVLLDNKRKLIIVHTCIVLPSETAINL